MNIIVSHSYLRYLRQQRHVRCSNTADQNGTYQLSPGYFLCWLKIALLLITFSFAGAATSSPYIDPELREKLKKAISESDSFVDRFDAEVWLTEKSKPMHRFIKDRDYALHVLKEVHGAAKAADVRPEFVLAVIQIESHFDRFAISSAGAQGMMQIMPFWKKEIGRDTDNLMDLSTNLKYGCTILKHYLDRENGDWKNALARYNGSYGKYWYPEKVLVAWQKYWR